MQKSLAFTVEKVRAERRDRASRGMLPNFAVGDVVLVAEVCRQGTASDLLSTWTDYSG